MVKKVIQKLANSAGFQISKIPAKNLERQHSYYRNEAMIAGLKRSVNRLPNVATVIDVGAAAGTWSQSAEELWKSASYVLFEPLEERKSDLIKLVQTRKNFHYVQAAAGSAEGTVKFMVASDLDGSGMAATSAEGSHIREVRVARIDEQIHALNLKGPYVLKLDTHGFEVPILEGCEGIIRDISLLIIECYGFRIAEKSLLFWEMCEYMDALGYRLIDIVDIMYRPSDNAFWQCDAFFVPKSLRLFENNSYC